MGQSSDIVRQWFERVWNQGDAGFIDQALCKECEVTGLSEGTITSREEFHQFHDVLNAVFAEIQVEIEQLMENGDAIAGVVMVHATHRATSKRVSFQSSFCGTLKDGKVYRTSNLVDYLSALTQIGALPDDAVARGLLGQSA